MRKVAFAAGFAIGYLLGSKAGRERYEQIMRSVQRLRENPTVQSAAGLVQAQAERVGELGKDAIGRTRIGAAVLGEHNGGHHHRDDFTPPAHPPQGF